MNQFRSYKATLQATVEPGDAVWSYQIHNLPSPEQTNAAGLVKGVSVVSSDAKQEIVLRFENAPLNRVTRVEILDKFLLLSFADFWLPWPPSSPGEPSRLATGKENGDYMTTLLTTGMVLNGAQYQFLGHSNSQLNSRSCFNFAATKEEISAKVKGMGDLSKLKSVGKKAKRIGFLFF